MQMRGFSVLLTVLNVEGSDRDCGFTDLFMRDWCLLYTLMRHMFAACYRFVNGNTCCEEQLIGYIK